MAEKKAIMIKINKAITSNDKEFALKDKELASLGPKLTSAKERKKKLEKKLAEQEIMRNNMNVEKSDQQKILKELNEEIITLKQTEIEIDEKLNEESSSLHMVISLYSLFYYFILLLYFINYDRNHLI